MSDRLKICDACDGDGGGDYCSGHYGGEPVYQHVTCGECGGTGQIDVFAARMNGDLLPGEPIPRDLNNFTCDLDEEIPF